MKKLPLLFLLVVFATNMYAQDAIAWQEGKQLTWENYLATPIEGMPMNAMTSARPVIEMSSSQTGKDVTITYSVRTLFFPADSWAVEKNPNLSFLLEHEQLYFDIAELFSRKLRKSLKDYNYTSNFAEEYQALYNHYTSERNSYQQLYALKTQFGGNTKEQKKWAKKIAKELEDLADYAETDFTVSFQAKEIVEETEE